MRNNVTINEFRGEYSFLSNFYEVDIYCWGFKYKNAEAAFQAMKNPAQASKFTDIGAKTAKWLGRQAVLRSDWEQVKERTMYEICLAKFMQHPDLREKLLATSDKYLVEGNRWGDSEWGVCNGKGKNKFGKILMRIREELRGGKVNEND